MAFALIPDTNFMDMRIAWRIQNENGRSLTHHKKCQAATNDFALLCNCGAVVKEWERRVVEQGNTPGTPTMA